ncbi:MAG: Lrp/AsnC family transcriptional regulator [Nitrososphaerota archaeon]|nr:Lrp/AsnC family transcriptional regulator [Candidatus Geocrenenecus dongiae]
MSSKWETLDEVDLKILEILKRDGRKSFVEIGKMLGLSEGAVRRRVKLMQEKGIIRRFTVEIAMDAVVNAVSFIFFEKSEHSRELLQRIAEIDSVEKVYELTGRIDAIALISARNISELNRCIDEIRRLEGVKATETAVILRVVK